MQMQKSETGYIPRKHILPFAFHVRMRCSIDKYACLSPVNTKTICITFIQRWTNVFDVDPTLYKYYTNVLCLLEFFTFRVAALEGRVPGVGPGRVWRRQLHQSASRQNLDARSRHLQFVRRLRLIYCPAGPASLSGSLCKPEQLYLTIKALNI